MKLILVAIDGSKPSNRVLEAGIKLAKEINCKIILLNVVPPAIIPEDFSEYVKTDKVDIESIRRYWMHLGETILNRFAEQLVASNIEHEKLIEVGDASETIIKVAKARACSYILVGIIGLQGARRIFTLGSVARRVIENSPIPVIAVP